MLCGTRAWHATRMGLQRGVRFYDDNSQTILVQYQHVIKVTLKGRWRIVEARGLFMGKFCDDIDCSQALKFND